MNALARRNRRPVLFTVFSVFVVAFWGAAHSTIVTPSDAVTTHVVVRALPSTNSAKLGTLAPGDQAEELESVPNWLKVQLVDGTIGYVSKRWVIEVQRPSPSPTPTPTTGAPSPSPTPSPTPTLTATPSATATPSTPLPGGQGFDPGCTLPFDPIKQKHPIIDDSCSIDGSKRDGGNLSQGKLAENHVKNNFCSVGPPVDISYDNLLQLETARQEVHDAQLPDAATRKAKLTNVIVVDGQNIGEGTLVRLVIHVINAEYADTKAQFPTTYGESVNCYRPSDEENDVHIVLGQQTNADECTSVTAEMSPHFRPAQWTPDNVKSVGEHPVRVTGQLFYDSSHFICSPGNQPPPKRASLWEIHPVYAFEVCELTDIGECEAAPESSWRPLDQFAP